MLYWEEENRLMVLKDNNGINRYTYNAAGERIMKSYGTMEGVYINGAPQGITFHETDNFTLYPASILSVNKNRFTKHYFIGDKRIASRIGTGLFNNVYGRNGSYVTAGQQDYAERMNQIQKQKEAYYKQQGIAPGVPTEKGAYGDPENTGVGYNAVLTELGNHDVPQGWIQTPKPNTTPNTNPGPPVSWNDPSNPDDPQAGYGYIPNDTTREETFFYHSDHLGSTSYITGDHTNITQYDAYLPYGELLVDEHSSSEDMPYKFNGKELDEETGLYYYGARYMDPKISMWLGVDPLMEKYTNVSGYVFCHSNPIVRIDRDGCADYFSISGKFIRSDKSKDKNIYIRTSSGNVLLSKYNFKRNLRAMMRITYHYAKEVGLEGKAKSIGVKSMKSNPEGELAITTYDNRIRVSTVNGHFKKSMDQIYNFRSTLAHEGFHIDTPNGVDEEVLVIMKEMSRKEFGKTTRSFKDNTAGYLQKELEKLYAVSGRNFYKVIGKAQKMLNKYGAKSSYEFIEGGNKIHF